MSFMQQQIQKGSWLLVDGPCGVDAIPANLFSREVIESFGHTGAEWRAEPDSEGFERLFASISDYTENREAWSIELKRGFGARLSAPGYMDCTEWSVFDTEQEAQEFLDEFYGEAEDEGEDEDAEG